MLIFWGASYPASRGSMLLCTCGTSDVRKNVWVLSSLLRVSVSCYGAWLHSHTSSMYKSASPSEAARLEVKWCEVGIFLTRFISPPWKIPLACLLVRVDGLGQAVWLKQVQIGSFKYGLHFTYLSCLLTLHVYSSQLGRVFFLELHLAARSRK